MKNSQTFLLIFPAALHLVAFSFCVVKYGGIDFTIYDLIFYIFFIAYLAVAYLLASDREKTNKLILVVYSIIFSVIATDALFRLFIPTTHFATPWIPMRRVSVAGDAMPGISGEIELTVNKYGLRGPDVDLDDYRHKIICIGGSSTESLYVTDKRTWPWLLMDKLNSIPGHGRVFVGNAGRSGHFSLHHQMMLENYSLIDRFDWAVFLVGINDMGRLLRGDYQDQKKMIEDQVLEYKYAYKSSPYYDRLLANVILSHGRVRPPSLAYVEQDPEGKWYDDLRQLRRQALSVNTVDRLPEALPEMLSQYRTNLLRIIETGRQRGLRMLFLTQPTLYRSDLSPYEEGLLWQHIDSRSAYSAGALAEMIAAYNKTLQDVCSREQIPCLDLAALLPKDTSVFYDDCHFNLSGSAQVADVLYSFFPRVLAEPGQPRGTTP